MYCKVKMHFSAISSWDIKNRQISRNQLLTSVSLGPVTGGEDRSSCDSGAGLSCLDEDEGDIIVDKGAWTGRQPVLWACGGFLSRLSLFSWPEGGRTLSACLVWTGRGCRTRLTCDSGDGLSCIGEDEKGIIIVDKGCDWLEPTVACCLVNAISGWCSEIYLEELGWVPGKMSSGASSWAWTGRQPLLWAYGGFLSWLSPFSWPERGGTLSACLGWTGGGWLRVPVEG